MSDADIQGPFDGTVTFMRVPFSRDLGRSKAAILGVPFDMGTHPVRIGSRQGPAAIREQSYLVRPYEPPLFDFNPLVEPRGAEPPRARGCSSCRGSPASTSSRATSTP